MGTPRPSPASPVIRLPPTLRVAVLCSALLGGCDPPASRHDPLAAPDYQAHTRDGQRVALSDHRGEVLLVNAWASWCRHCLAEMPGLQQVHEVYLDRGLRVIGVNIDARRDQAAAVRLLFELGIGYDIWMDPDNHIGSALLTLVTPETLLIDRQGQVVYRWRGRFDPMSSRSRARYAAVLAAPLPGPQDQAGNLRSTATD